MLAVEARDRQRMERVAAGDAAGFWELVQENHDDLKWCGSSPVYTFLKAVPDARGNIRALRAVEHRSAKRRQLRGHVVPVEASSGKDSVAETRP
jgi:predicted class III extradiol MEMO1 family dioxygenase